MNYNNVTFMICVPRSRSRWLTEFLKPIATTMHDPLKQCESIADLQFDIDQRLRIAPERPVFVADTAAVFFIDDIVERFPGAKYLFVKRGQEDVSLSLMRAGFAVGELAQCYTAWTHAFAKINYIPDSDAKRYTLHYQAMNACLYKIWQFVAGNNDHPLHKEYVADAIAANIQVPMAQQNAETNVGKITKLFESRSRG